MAKIQTRARAVDMLGRQQIAGIQNALSELFKNTHDAYGLRARVDYFEDSGPQGECLTIVRDDGVGMTRRDFEQKWLVLGTESKTGASRDPDYRPPQMVERPITGEKGIGRLAIALLGSQVLILTRAVREDGLHDLVAAMVNWDLFALPGVNLEEIEVPIATFAGGTLPDLAGIKRLRDELVTCAERIAADHADTDTRRIIRDIESFVPDPASLSSFLSERDASPLTLEDQGTGTHFFIGPSNPIIKIELASEARNDDYSFRRQILGFCDRTFGDVSTDLIATSFRRWLPGAIEGEELLDENAFFTRKELYEQTDHFLTGAVDEFGQFNGLLQVYDQKYADLVIPWPDSKGEATKCGPFHVTFGYLMGNQSESKLSPEDFGRLNSKLKNLGGMYVYRDRIRVLPYGDYSNDWLEVEKRRNKGAGYYFFSFRRMLGAVMLTRKSNGNLQEKAGREGFQQNEAYRQLRDILINLLVQLAADFFRKEGTNTEVFERSQTEIRRRSQVLERQQKRATAKRKKFQDALASFSHETTAGLPDVEVANLRKLTRSRMEAASRIADQDKAAAALIRAEQDAVSQLNALRSKYTCRRPSGVALTRDLTREWDGYLIERARLDSKVFSPFEEEIGHTLGLVAKQARVYVDQRRRLEERIRVLADERKRDLVEASKQANASATDTRQTVFSITEKARLALDQAIQNIQADLNRTDLNTLEPEQIEQMRKKWEDNLTQIEARHRDALMAARDMLASLAENLRSSDGEEPAQVLEALEQRMISLEEQADEDFEMVQLGLAVAIINHEFAASIKRVRESIKELGQVSRKSAGLRPLYESIRTNFEHLDGHLNLFTPLQRRLYRTAQKIGGKSIRNYINDLFSNRFERHRVVVECTDAFLSAQIECYPSTLYPTMINLVDNAVFWLDSVKGRREIRLDAESGSLLVSNNGPAIEPRDWERIFQRGFSRKPGGRGLGLFISSRALQSEKMTISLEEPPAGLNVTFRIAIPTLSFVP
jgi:signal transduction histidine kinase